MVKDCITIKVTCIINLPNNVALKRKPIPFRAYLISDFVVEATNTYADLLVAMN